MCRLFFCLLILVLYCLNSFSQSRYSVVITEFLADPSPAIGLPSSSFVELKNITSIDLNLRNWKISNGNTTATIKSDCLLKADSFLILCASSAAKDFESFGRTVGISSFPALDNVDGGILLSNDSGEVMDGIHYDQSWFDNDLKAAGGWSLEIIDPTNRSGKPNWIASSALLGGTPGQTNSAIRENPDLQSPSLLRALTIDSSHIQLIFDEALDSLSVTGVDDYLISGQTDFISKASTAPPYFDRIDVFLSKFMNAGMVYTLTANQITDCNGNEIGAKNFCLVGLPQKPESGDLIFNEILFNPPPFGFDYLELFNRSNKIISCPDLFLAAKNPDGSLKDISPLAKEVRLLFPGEYLLLTENPDWVLRQYAAADYTSMQKTALPSLSDDDGKILLLDKTGETIDELDYNHHWHSPLLANEEGVALERINPASPTNDSSNWTSASAGSGYGTPGYKNTAFHNDTPSSGEISVTPKIFSPDMDGYEDFCFIHYQLTDPDFLGSIWVYDINGRIVRQLVNNRLWGTEGSFRWDGLDEKLNPLPRGRYIIYMILFRPQGRTIEKKMVVTLAKKN